MVLGPGWGRRDDGAAGAARVAIAVNQVLVAGVRGLIGVHAGRDVG